MQKLTQQLPNDHNPQAMHIDPHSIPFTPLPLPANASALVKVSILINGRFSANPQLFVMSSQDEGYSQEEPPWEAYPVFCFLLEKDLGDGKVERTLFDLGIRKDRDSFSPNTSNTVIPYFPPTECPDVVESLSRGGLSPKNIDCVILSHDHFDHVGDPCLFPASTRFMIGDFTNPGAEESLIKMLEEFTTPMSPDPPDDGPESPRDRRGSGLIPYGNIMRRSSSLGMPRAHTTSFSPSKGAHGDIFSKQTADTIPEDTDELTGEESQREQERSRGRRRSSEVSKGTNVSIRETSFFINPFQKKAGEASRGRPQNSRRSKSGEPSQQEQSKNGSFQDAFRETLLTVVTDKLRSVWKQKRAPWRKLLLDPAVIWQPLGSFERAHDYYGDGSFWIIDAPGHCQGHIMALARTTTSPPTYILFASDAAHAKCLYSPCPVASSADTRAQVGLYGDGYQVAGLPLKELTQSVHDNLSEAYSTIARLSRMDLLDEVFVIAAHETEVESVVELYPESANNWLKKNWKHKTREAMEANNAMDKRDSGRILEDKGGAEVKQLAFELENILSSPIKRTSCSP